MSLPVIRTLWLGMCRIRGDSSLSKVGLSLILAKHCCAAVAFRYCTHNSRLNFLNAISCLAPDDRRNDWLKKRVSHPWRPPKWLVKEKGVASLKYTANIKRRSDKWNLEWPSLLSLGHLVIVNIRIINVSTVEQNVSAVQIEEAHRFLEIHLEKKSSLTQHPYSLSAYEK